MKKTQSQSLADRIEAYFAEVAEMGREATLEGPILSSSTKTVKGEKRGWLTGISYLSPADGAGVAGVDVCRGASAGCRAACLNTAGRGVMRTVQLGRIRRLLWLLSDPEAYHSQLDADIATLQRKADREGMGLCIRLDGTSDLDWGSVFDRHPGLQFYDYTKRLDKVRANVESTGNHHLTFSRSENNWGACKTALDLGINVAVVFRGGLPATYEGRRVVSGDDTDLRFLDPVGATGGLIVGLTAKGLAKTDPTGFVVDPV